MKRGTIRIAGWRGVIGAVLAASVLTLTPLGTAPQAKGLDRSSPPQATEQPATAVTRSIDLFVRDGDTLFAMLGRAGIKADGRAAVMDALKDLFDPRTLRPGDRIRLVLQSRKGTLVVRSMELELNARDDVAVDVAGTTARDRAIEQITFASPVKGGELTSPFGWRIHPVFGDRRFHKGVDFRAPKGTPVSVSADGVVVEVGWRGNYGKYIRVRHTDAIETTYSHLSGYAAGLRSGKRVRQGQIIGYVGRTGVATGNHLYYEMLINGEHVDPLDPPPLIPAQLDGRKLTAIRSAIRADTLN